jgi:phospholipid/cholesterol/gamma-HCH transport system substrate-binding protein
VSDRSFRILTGLVTLLFLFSATVAGVKIAAGSLRDVYQVHASFAAAGQGLIQQSDVKIHGVNIGRVAKVTLENGRAHVRMDINASQKVPVSSKAIIRPKTLFGEKFVDIDPGEQEASGPFLEDEGVIKNTLGGFELERVLTDLYPILQAVKPEQLDTVLHTLAAGGEGLGPNVNRAIENFTKLADVQARHAADTQEFLDDLALLSGELADKADDLVGAATDLNTVLPDLNQRGDQLAVFLEQAGRLSHDLADVLETNRPFLQKAVTEGGKTLEVLYQERAQIQPLVTGLRQFLQILAEATRIPRSDGTTMAAIKFVFGEDCATGRIEPCVGPGLGGASQGAEASGGAQPSQGLAPIELAPPTRGARGLIDLITGLLP